MTYTLFCVLHAFLLSSPCCIVALCCHCCFCLNFYCSHFPPQAICFFFFALLDCSKFRWLFLKASDPPSQQEKSIYKNKNKNKYWQYCTSAQRNLTIHVLMYICMYLCTYRQQRTSRTHLLHSMILLLAHSNLFLLLLFSPQQQTRNVEFDSSHLCSSALWKVPPLRGETNAASGYLH